MSILSFDAGGFRFVDTEGDARATQRVNEQHHTFTESALYNARRERQAQYCETAAPGSVIRFAVTKGGRDRGGLLLYDIVTLFEDRWVKRIAAKMGPAYIVVHEPDFLLDIAIVMEHFLDNELPMDDGRSLDLDEWRFPNQAEGDKPQHQWPSEYAVAITDYLTSRGRFVDHERRDVGDVTGRGGVRDVFHRVRKR